ncbi:hypothetical protein CIW48_21320 [Methylobacterium sp. P1-11]|uniref:hypothetical protein n=1 Tax=Methylobacterium sp. P1-11 TaxID=2024616 RepID=UPI0011F043CA|nr:hypothetical protein [Methylobacterium sp. P1-11]KAA0121890.1 hypothetical protein CIW48_21320 [Methylobacterium sp. P1-11]
MDTGPSSPIASATFAGFDVEEAVRALVDGGALRLSERNRRFLAFVVHETLCGRSERIKAYAIGVDVFGRGPCFDPSTDPIVRIEATRIRTALAAYYEGPGANDPFRIVLRPGSYIPEFELAKPVPLSVPEPVEQEPDAVPVPPDMARISLVVIHRTNRRDRCAMATGEMYVQAVVRAAAGHGFRVFVIPHPERRAAAQTIQDLLGCSTAVFALEISVHGIAEGRRYAWSLSDLRSGEIRGSDFVDQVDEEPPAATRINTRAEAVARRVANVVL